MKKLPIGIQTFANLITENYCYVDKTRFVSRLADEGKYYFLSRPRRFGKSLFLSTLKSAFSGEKELFQGLFLEKNWDWNVTYPVVHISFGAGVVQNKKDLYSSFGYILDDHARKYEISYTYEDPKNRFAQLIQILHDMFKMPVVVLVDEYDKPILDNISNTQTAIAIREELKNIYSVIKDSDPYIKFVFITGVSKFSKVSLFSGLNNLNDITLTARYSAICGYTQKDIETVFADRLEGVNLDEVKKWYNGYNWLGEEVYNPFDVLLFLDKKEFRNYWFETGTPTFLIKLLQSGHYYIPDLQHLTAGEEIVGSFDVEDIRPETLLFQTGYLTIQSMEQVGAFRRYHLTYPNLEVMASLNNYILGAMVEDRLAKTRNQSDVLDALMANDFQKLEKTFHAFFSSIPHEWYRKNEIAHYEGYYASIVYCYFASLGLEVHPEEPTNQGQIDLVIRFEDRIYLLEFKVVEIAETGNALEQVKEKKYHEKYAGQEMYLVGVEFSRKDRNIVRFEWEKIVALDRKTSTF